MSPEAPKLPLRYSSSWGLRFSMYGKRWQQRVCSRAGISSRVESGQVECAGYRTVSENTYKATVSPEQKTCTVASVIHHPHCLKLNVTQDSSELATLFKVVMLQFREGLEFRVGAYTWCASYVWWWHWFAVVFISWFGLTSSDWLLFCPYQVSGAPVLPTSSLAAGSRGS